MLYKFQKEILGGLRITSTNRGNFYFDGFMEFEATVVEFNEPPLILFTSGSSGDLNDLFSQTSKFTKFPATDDVEY